MKRRVLIRHLERNGCELLREGSKHSIYTNHTKRKVSTVPRRNEIYDNLCIKICKDMDVPLP